MKIFLDTSSLIKLYFFEDGTVSLESFISANDVESIFLSEISTIEFESTLWKKVRMKELLEENVRISLQAFETDRNKYEFISIYNTVLTNARNLITKYGIEGLTTLDSIQLSCCIEVKEKVDKYFTADKLLLNIIEKENLPT